MPLTWNCNVHGGVTIVASYHGCTVTTISPVSIVQEEEQYGARGGGSSRSSSLSGDDTPGPAALRQPRRAPKRKASAGVGTPALHRPRLTPVQLPSKRAPGGGPRHTFKCAFVQWSSGILQTQLALCRLFDHVTACGGIFTVTYMIAGTCESRVVVLSCACLIFKVRSCQAR